MPTVACLIRGGLSQEIWKQNNHLLIKRKLCALVSGPFAAIT
uniref:Uncharacterized protein n=1 Tax=Anguilla anguilla TaxID=7936 RepID=A0A0E9TXU7_ANGAN